MSDIEEVDETTINQLEESLGPLDDDAAIELDEPAQFQQGDFVTDDEFANLDLYALNASDDEASGLLDGNDHIVFPPDDDEPEARPRRKISLIHLLYCIYFLGVCIPIATVATIDRNKPCDQPLKEWVWIFLCFQVLTLIVETYLAYVIKPMLRRHNEENLTMSQRLHRKVVFFFERILNLFWLFWFIMGMVWTFRSKTCSHHLYRLCMSLIILHLSIVGLAFMFCCCSLMFMGLLYIFHPTLFRSENRGASDKVIGKTTEEVVFTEGMYEADDAKCAICLSEYDDGDGLRTLPCKHHFHAECVDEWLHRNKSCPYCKRIIDATPDEAV
mmetsp:Transcript_30012/g.33514  ORF Transcript_30012/g.33514 Transcript_30012/m.33514 type:complete len:329 (+) Transcript_30012:53-1039(+)